MWFRSDGAVAGHCRMGIPLYSAAVYVLAQQAVFSVDVWLPEGTRIEESDRQMTEMTAYLNSLEGVKKVSSFVGQTPPRYYLANAAYGPQPNYAQCLVEADTPEKSRELQAMLYDRLPAMFPV